MKIREPSSADMTRMALTEKREREPGIVVVLLVLFWWFLGGLLDLGWSDGLEVGWIVPGRVAGMMFRWSSQLVNLQGAFSLTFDVMP